MSEQNQDPNNTSDIINLEDILGSGMSSSENYNDPTEDINNLPDLGGEEGKEGEGGNPNPKEGISDKDKDKDIPKNEEPQEGGEEDSYSEVKEYLSELNKENLTEEEREDRDTLLSIFNGVGIDENFNIIDGAGNIVADVKDVNQFVQEGGFYDKEGNLVSPKGEIIKTKDEVKSTYGAFDTLYEKVGYELLDEEGNPKKYTPDPDGLAEYVKDVSTQIAQDMNKQLFESNPELKEVAKHILSGGSIKDFEEIKDYSSIDASNLSKSEKLSYIRQSYIESGLDESRVDRNLKRIEDANEIDAELEDALKVLDKKELEKREERDERLQQTIQKKNEEIREYWGQVKETISKGTIKDINIPETEREAFFDYLAKPVKDNKSQEMLDRENEDIERQIQLSYLRYKGFNLGDLVKKEVKDSRAKSIKERMKEYREGSSRKNDPNSKKANPIKDLTLDNIL